MVLNSIARLVEDAGRFSVEGRVQLGRGAKGRDRGRRFRTSRRSRWVAAQCRTVREVDNPGSIVAVGRWALGLLDGGGGQAYGLLLGGDGLRADDHEVVVPEGL